MASLPRQGAADEFFGTLLLVFVVILAAPLAVLGYVSAIGMLKRKSDARGLAVPAFILLALSLAFDFQTRGWMIASLAVVLVNVVVAPMLFTRSARAWCESS